MLSSSAFMKNALVSNAKNTRSLTYSVSIPSLLETAGYCFFVGGYFVGPQFSMNHYRRAIQHNLVQRY